MLVSVLERVALFLFRALFPTSHANARAGDDAGVFSMAPDTGQLFVIRDQQATSTGDILTSLDFERNTSFTFTVSVGRRGFDSGWFPMRSMSSGSGECAVNLTCCVLCAVYVGVFVFSCIVCV
jgi:hypothetical protein